MTQSPVGNIRDINGPEPAVVLGRALGRLAPQLWKMWEIEVDPNGIRPSIPVAGDGGIFYAVQVESYELVPDQPGAVLNRQAVEGFIYICYRVKGGWVFQA